MKKNLAAVYKPDSDIRAIIGVIGPEAAEKLVMHFGGCLIYIPKAADKRRRADRNANILADHAAGASTSGLKQKYNLSRRSIQEIIKTGCNKNRNSR